MPSTVRGKYDFLSRFRFNLCFENELEDGYLTEKLFDSLVSGAVPLYAGDRGFGQWFKTEAVVDCHGLSAGEIADRIRQAEKDGLPEQVEESRERLVRVSLPEMLKRIGQFAAEIETWKVARVESLSRGPAAHYSSSFVAATSSKKEARLSNLTAVASVSGDAGSLTLSSDGFRIVLKECQVIVVADDPLAASLVQSASGIALANLPEGSGISACLNQGVAAAGTEYVMMVGGDCSIESEANGIRRCLQLLGEGWDLVGAQGFRFDASGTILWLDEEAVEEEIMRCDATMGLFIARKDFLLRYCWDEDLSEVFGRADFFLRLRQAGAKVGASKLLRQKCSEENTGSGIRRDRASAEKFARRWGYADVVRRTLTRSAAQAGGEGRDVLGIRLCSTSLRPREGWLDLGKPECFPSGWECGMSLPLRDGSIRMAWVEGVLERSDYSAGVALLGELYRVLAPGGILRVVTFDLAFLARLLCFPDNAGADYIRWASDHFIPQSPGYDPAFVVNHQMRAWGHKFLHDESTLADALETAGFSSPVRCKTGVGCVPSLADLDRPERLPSGFYSMESLILEASKALK